MAQKYTHQDFLNKLKEKDKKLHPLEQYINSTTKILFECDICGNQWKAAPAQILSKTNCPACQNKKRSIDKTISLEEYKKRLHIIRPTLQVYQDNFTGMKNPVSLICPNGHIWELNRADAALVAVIGNDCPYCNNKKFLEENSVFYIRPDLVQYFINKEDSKKVTAHSMQYFDFICPICKNKKHITVDNLSSKGFNCNYCKKDGISYPNKILRSFLFQLQDQFDNQNFDLEWCFNGYRFDGKFIINNQVYVIEMQGRQHYEQVFPFLNLEDQLIRDQNKKAICLSNNIIEIEIDCYNSDFSYIKQSILNSDLNILLNLSCIDWIEIQKQAVNNLILECIKLKERGYNNQKIADNLKISIGTVKAYLKNNRELF